MKLRELLRERRVLGDRSRERLYECLPPRERFFGERLLRWHLLRDSGERRLRERERPGLSMLQTHL